MSKETVKRYTPAQFKCGLGDMCASIEYLAQMIKQRGTKRSELCIMHFFRKWPQKKFSDEFLAFDHKLNTDLELAEVEFRVPELGKAYDEMCDRCGIDGAMELAEKLDEADEQARASVNYTEHHKKRLSMAGQAWQQFTKSLDLDM